VILFVVKYEADSEKIGKLINILRD